jgi:threonine dehydrogenase-like Zn-dependent dehydrogenase
VKQILQHLRSGQIELAEVPAPLVRAGHLLLQTSVSLISPGTERMLVEFGQAGWIGKARAQPERVRQVLAKMRTDGLLPTMEAVFSRLDEPLPLGYCNVGRVLDVGRGVEGFAVGNRVACNGPHAEIVCVPATLAARIPDDVDDEAASFTVLGAVALNGIRLLEPTLGESVAVVGLGLLGMLAVQLLRAHGCRVIGIDINPARAALARRLGCATIAAGGDPVRAARELSRGRGVDAVLITASAQSDEIVHQAAQMSRKRGRIVLVGVVGLDLQRADFYEKELSLQVACSYGPGRYDPQYESGLHDYPLSFVRWTAARNFEAVLDALARGALDVRELISQRHAQRDAPAAYDAIVNDPTALGVMLSYPHSAEAAPTVRLLAPAGTASAPSRPVVGVIGAGNFARQVLLPAIAAAGAEIRAIASAGGVTSLHAGRRFGSGRRRPTITASWRTRRSTPSSSRRGTTRTRAWSARRWRRASTCSSRSRWRSMRRVWSSSAPPMPRIPTGSSWSASTAASPPIRSRRAGCWPGRPSPWRCRSWSTPASCRRGTGWTTPRIRGGRIIGEACHFIDLALFLIGSPITAVQAIEMRAGNARGDTLSIGLGSPTARSPACSTGRTVRAPTRRNASRSSPAVAC